MFLNDVQIIVMKKRGATEVTYSLFLDFVSGKFYNIDYLVNGENVDYFVVLGVPGNDHAEIIKLKTDETPFSYTPGKNSYSLLLFGATSTAMILY